MNRPASCSCGQVLELRAGLKVTRAGSSEREAKDWHVKPAGPLSVAAVMTVSPEAKWPRTWRRRCGVRSKCSVMFFPFETGNPNQPPLSGLFNRG
ncbi:hypothetical protein RKD54_004029 [Pseudarthrobacter sp. SLBN-100]